MSDYDERQLIIQRQCCCFRELFEVETSTTAFEYVVTLMSRLSGAA
jgi:hypothetical protein